MLTHVSRKTDWGTEYVHNCELGEHGIPAPLRQALTGRGRNSLLTEFTISDFIGKALVFSPRKQLWLTLGRSPIAVLASIEIGQKLIFVPIGSPGHSQGYQWSSGSFAPDPFKQNSPQLLFRSKEFTASGAKNTR
jgi:hypothetical protein